MLKETIASAFKAKGKKTMDRKEITYTLSFDLKYFSHETSKKVVELAEKRGLLRERNGELEPAFDVGEVTIPPDFKPDVNRIFHDETIFDRIVDEISEATGKEKAEIIREVNRKQMELGNVLDVEVVALLYGLEMGVDLKEYIPEVEREILGR
ncbi:MAG: DUF2240 family protein [Archaeoglobi archaeon]|nr:DUF2240 family protein [Archaeoglobi archaeon]